MGVRALSLIHPDDREMAMSEWVRCSALGQPLELDFRLKRFDEVYRWVHFRVEPLLDEQGRIVRWYGLLTDVDDRREMEEALRTIRRISIGLWPRLSGSSGTGIPRPRSSAEFVPSSRRPSRLKRSWMRTRLSERCSTYFRTKSGTQHHR
jgi:PAS fold